MNNGSPIPGNPAFGSPPRPGGGGSPTWLRDARNRALALGNGLGVTFDSEWDTDFADSAKTAFLIGGGTGTYSQTAKGGVVTLSTGAGAGQSVRIVPISQPTIIADLGTGALYCRWRIRFNGPASAGANTVCGVTAPGFGSQINFGLVGTTTGGSNTNFSTNQFYAAANHVNVTGTLVELAAFHTVELIVGAGSAQFYLDGTLLGPNIVTTVNYAGIPAHIQVLDHTIDVVDRILTVDKLYCAFQGQ